MNNQDSLYFIQSNIIAPCFRTHMQKTLRQKIKTQIIKKQGDISKSEKFAQSASEWKKASPHPLALTE